MEVTLQGKCQAVMCGGAAVAVVPATVTLLIASSKIIAIHVIANTIIRILTGGRFGITIHNLSLIKVPLLWKISRVTAMVGAAFTLPAAVVLLCDAAYHRKFEPFAPSLG